HICTSLSVFSTSPPARRRVMLCRSFLMYCSGDHRHLHSFPTRRSSDLARRAVRLLSTRGAADLDRSRARGPCSDCPRWWRRSPRSEEHTSELQSRENLVCRLLLEKKRTCAAPAKLIQSNVVTGRN